jgi:hypothetical protein
MGGDLRPFDRIRRQRHSIEYPAMDAQPLHEDVVDELPKAETIIDLAGKVLDQMSPF